MKIVVVGSSNTDMVIKTARIPAPGETVIGGTFSMAAGGKGANQAVAAARAGGEVAIVARVGTDMFGDEALKGFQGDGLDVRYVYRDPVTPSGVALIFVDEKGENSIAVSSGANGVLSVADVEGAHEMIRGAGVLLTQLETPLDAVLSAARIAAEHRVRLVLNPAPARQLPEDLLRQVSILTPNESEAELLTGIAVRTEEDAAGACAVLHSRGVKEVILTMGRRGAFVSSPNITEFLPAYSVKAVDTTAAGDVFNGALCVALVEGKGTNDAARFASAAAAMSVTRLGAQPSAPRRAEIDAFLKDRGS